MINADEVKEIHRILIEKFGGSFGIRDLNILESALARPFSTFDGKELYPTTIEKASALLESIVKNHPFIDGNKRVGYTLIRLLLLQNNLDIEATEEEKYFLIIEISKGNLNFQIIKEWLSLKVKDHK